MASTPNSRTNQRTQTNTPRESRLPFGNGGVQLRVHAYRLFRPSDKEHILPCLIHTTDSNLTVPLHLTQEQEWGEGTAVRMWLSNARTLALEEVVDPEKYEHAIRSHRWGRDEVGFHDMADLHRVRGMAGFHKI